jgi:hypothetical protein
VRATPLPAALPVAVAAFPLLAATMVPPAAPSAALAERWLRPVPGEVARSFDYARAAPFARGAHRGADLAARPGTPVRAACGGRVVHAGPVAGRDGVVSVSCGVRRVSYLPLDAIAVRAGAEVRAGAALGAVAPGHGGLHVGVRREGDPFGYEDPLALLPAAGAPGVPVAAPRLPLARPPRPRLEPARRARRPRVRPVPVRPAVPTRPRPEATRRALPARSRPEAAVRAVPTRPHPEAVRPAVPTSSRPGPAPGPAPRPHTPAGLRTPGVAAPWPVWLGLALLACGAAGSRTIVLRRRRQAARSPLPALDTVR